MNFQSQQGVSGLSPTNFYTAPNVARGVLAGFVCSLLFNPVAPFGDVALATNQDGSERGWSLCYQTAADATVQFEAIIGDTGGTPLSVISLPQAGTAGGKWILLTLVVIGTAVELYGNGNLLASGTLPNGYAPAIGAQLEIGDEPLVPTIYGGFGYTEDTSIFSNSVFVGLHAQSVQQTRRMYAQTTYNSSSALPPLIEFENAWDALSALGAGLTAVEVGPVPLDDPGVFERPRMVGPWPPRSGTISLANAGNAAIGGALAAYLPSYWQPTAGAS